MSSEENESSVVEIIEYEEQNNTDDTIQFTPEENGETSFLNENEDNTVTVTYECNNARENLKIKDLVCNKFGFDEWVYKRIIENGFDLESLKLSTESEIKDLFPRPFLGLRAKFKYHLNAWRKDASSFFRQNCKCHLMEWNYLSKSPSHSTEKSVYSPSTSYASLENFNSNTLTELLSSTEKGLDVLNFYKKENALDEAHKNTLISVIIENFESNMQDIKMKDIENAVDIIQEIFPSENRQYYLRKRGQGLNPTGKLHDRAVNARIKIRKLKRSSRTQFENTDNTSATAPPTPEPEILPKELEEKVLWLAHNIEPWSEIEKKWSEVMEIRQNDIQNGKNILERWPLFKNVLGHTLVDFDYNKTKKDNPSNLLHLWPSFVEKIVPYLKKKVKDKNSLDLFKELKKDINANSRDCIIFLLLHAILKPPMLAVGKKGTKKYKWKPSISDAQESCLIYCNSVQQYVSQIEQLRKKYEDLGLTVQPLIIAIGADKGALEHFYTYYDGILYKFNSFLKCMDITFKIFHVMNFSYPKEGKNVYSFIENYFYNFKSDIINPNIESLLEMLSK